MWPHALWAKQVVFTWKVKGYNACFFVLSASWIKNVFPTTYSTRDLINTFFIVLLSWQQWLLQRFSIIDEEMGHSNVSVIFYLQEIGHTHAYDIIRYIFTTHYVYFWGFFTWKIYSDCISSLWTMYVKMISNLNSIDNYAPHVTLRHFSWYIISSF